MRAFVYTRQSLDRTGEGAAVERQREDCLRLCEERGWEVVEVFVDNDVSATSKRKRPAYSAMLAGVEAGHADTVVAWHVDRLVRKLTELEDLIELSARTGLRIATVTGDVDLSTDSGRLVGRILASVARGEVERKGARQKRAQEQAAAAGRYAGGRRPFGYGVPTGETRTVRGEVRPVLDMNGINETEAALIRQAYADLLGGAALKAIARQWNEAGVTTTVGGTWRHDNVREVLKNARYAGLRTHRGEIVGRAEWPALIDQATYDAAAALLALPERRTTTATARKYLLPGLALCWKCESDVATGHTRHGKRVYVCRANKCVSRKADPVDELVEAVMVERLRRPDDLAAALAISPDDGQERIRAAEIRQRLDDLAVGLEEGILTLGAVRKSSERLRAELQEIDAKLSRAAGVQAMLPLVSAPDIGAAWASLELAQKREWINALMRVTILAPERGRRDFDPESVRIEWKGSRDA